MSADALIIKGGAAITPYQLYMRSAQYKKKWTGGDGKTRKAAIIAENKGDNRNYWQQYITETEMKGHPFKAADGTIYTDCWAYHKSLVAPQKALKERIKAEANARAARIASIASSSPHRASTPRSRSASEGIISPSGRHSSAPRHGKTVPGGLARFATIRTPGPTGLTESESESESESDESVKGAGGGGGDDDVDEGHADVHEGHADVDDDDVDEDDADDVGDDDVDEGHADVHEGHADVDDDDVDEDDADDVDADDVDEDDDEPDVGGDPYQQVDDESLNPADKDWDIEQEHYDNIRDANLSVSIMTGRTGCALLASIVGCYLASVHPSETHLMDNAYANIDVENPNLKCPFLHNHTTVLIYDKETSVILCTLHPINNKEADGKIRSYESFRDTITQHRPKFKYKLEWIQRPDNGNWVLTGLNIKTKQTELIDNSNTTSFIEPPYSCDFDTTVCRNARNASAFFLRDNATWPVVVGGSGYYTAQVEDIVDDVYYNIDHIKKKQYKCFRTSSNWVVAEYDNIGAYTELFTSVSQSTGVESHPRNVQLWNTHSINVCVYRSYMYSKENTFYWRSCPHFTIEPVRIGTDVTMLHGIHDKANGLKYVYTIRRKKKMIYCVVENPTYDGHPDINSYTPVKPEFFPDILFANTMQLIECKQELVIYSIPDKKITARLQWSAVDSAFKYDTAQLKFEKKQWEFKNTGSSSSLCVSLHRQLPVVGIGFFLRPLDQYTPSHYCTHSRNIDAFTIGQHQFANVNKIHVNHVYSWGSDRSMMKKMVSDTKYRWFSNYKKGDININSREFNMLALDYVHPIYSEFETHGISQESLKKSVKLKFRDIQKQNDDVQNIERGIAENKRKSGEEHKQRQIDIDKLKAMLKDAIQSKSDTGKVDALQDRVTTAEAGLLLHDRQTQDYIMQMQQMLCDLQEQVARQNIEIRSIITEDINQRIANLSGIFQQIDTTPRPSIDVAGMDAELLDLLARLRETTNRAHQNVETINGIEANMQQIYTNMQNILRTTQEDEQTYRTDQRLSVTAMHELRSQMETACRQFAEDSRQLNSDARRRLERIQSRAGTEAERDQRAEEADRNLITREERARERERLEVERITEHRRQMEALEGERAAGDNTFNAALAQLTLQLDTAMARLGELEAANRTAGRAAGAANVEFRQLVGDLERRIQTLTSDHVTLNAQTTARIDALNVQPNDIQQIREQLGQGITERNLIIESFNSLQQQFQQLHGIPLELQEQIQQICRLLELGPGNQNAIDQLRENIREIREHMQRLHQESTLTHEQLRQIESIQDLAGTLRTRNEETATLASQLQVAARNGAVETSDIRLQVDGLLLGAQTSRELQSTFDQQLQDLTISQGRMREELSSLPRASVQADPPPRSEDRPLTAAEKREVEQLRSAMLTMQNSVQTLTNTISRLPLHPDMSLASVQNTSVFVSDLVHDPNIQLQNLHTQLREWFRLYTQADWPVRLQLNYADHRAISEQLRTFGTRISAIEADFTAQATASIAAADRARQNEQRRLDAMKQASDAQEALFQRWIHVIADISTQLQSTDKPPIQNNLMKRLHAIAEMVSADHTTRFRDALIQAFTGDEAWKIKINGMLDLMIRAADRRHEITSADNISILEDLETQFNEIMSDMIILHDQGPVSMDEDAESLKRARDTDNLVAQAKSLVHGISSHISHTTDLHDSAGAGSEHESAGVDPDRHSRRRTVTPTSGSATLLGFFHDRVFGARITERPSVDNGAAGGTSQETIRRRIEIEARRLHARNLLRDHNATSPPETADPASAEATVLRTLLRDELSRNSTIAEAASQTEMRESGHAFTDFARIHDISSERVDAELTRIVQKTDRSRLAQLWYDYTQNMRHDSTRADAVMNPWKQRYNKWLQKNNNPDASSGSSGASTQSWDPEDMPGDLDELPLERIAPMAGSVLWCKSKDRTTSWKNTEWNTDKIHLNFKYKKSKAIRTAIQEAIDNDTDIVIRPQGENYDDEEWQLIVRRELKREKDNQKEKKK